MANLKSIFIQKKLFISEGYIKNHLDFKGIKNDYQSREFKIKSSTSLHSKQFNRYL
jgi:hypothetical protein